MTSFDPELLRRLADADAASPPAPGREFSPASRRALAARRFRRQVIAIMAALLLVAMVLALRPLATHAGDADTFDRSALRSLGAELETLRASLTEWSATRAAAERAAAEAALRSAATAKLRLQIAHTRAGAVLAGIPPMPVEETNR